VWLRIAAGLAPALSFPEAFRPAVRALEPADLGIGNGALLDAAEKLQKRGQRRLHETHQSHAR
jgi:hypothetical protein